MNRATALALLLLVVVGAGGAFVARATFRPDVLPAPLRLPESLASVPVAPPLSATPGFVALVAAAAFLLLWRRGVGQSPIVALLPAALLLLHPAVHTAAATAAGQLDLIAFAALLLGAWLTTVERSAWVAVGVLLLFVGVLGAPSGAAFAAFGAFVLVERRPTMLRGAWLLLVYGAARALGAPWLGDVFDPFRAPASVAVDGLGARALFEGVAAAHAPLASVPFVPASGPSWVAAALVGLLLVATLVVPAERRFGGRFLGPLALVALGLTALAIWNGGALPASAVAPVVCLIGIWVAAIGDDVERRPVRRVVSQLLAILLVGGVAWLGWRNLARLDDRVRFFVEAGPAAAEPAVGDPRARVALRARLPDEPAISLFRQVDARLAAAPDTTLSAVAVDRDLAVAAAFAGSPERAALLLERASEAAARLGESTFERAITLDRLDAHLRESRPDLALDVIEGAGEVSDDRHAAELRCREGLAWFLLAFQSSDDGQLPGTDQRDRALARARAAFDDAVALAPDAPRPRLERGRFELALGSPIEAVKELEACATARPDLAAPHVELARLYFTLGEDLDGERELARARGLAGKDDPEVRLVTAQLRVARRDVLGAVEMAEGLKRDVHRLRGGRAALGELYRLLARAAEDQKNLGLAEAMAVNALDLTRDRDGETTVRLSRILRQQRRFDEAVQVLEAAAAKGVPVPNLDEEIVLAFKNAGYAHLLASERREALDDFLEALRRSEEIAALGAVPKLVRELCDEFVDDVGPNVPTDEARRLYERGVAAYGALEDDRAGHFLRASLALLPRNPYAHYQLALVHLRQQREDEARTALREAIRTGEALGRPDVVENARRMLAELE